MQKIQEEIADVKTSIKTVEEKIDGIEKKLEREGLSDEDRKFWEAKELLLRKEKEQLRTKEEQLRRKEEKLMDKEESKQSGNEMAEILEYVRYSKENRTKTKSMSKASTQCAMSILAAYQVTYEPAREVVKSAGSFEDPQPYNWTIQTTEGKTLNKGEHQGTPGALEWLKANFLGPRSLYDLKVVTCTKLPVLHGNGIKAMGMTDLLIGAADDIHKGSTYAFAKGIVELKTDKYPLKVGQNLLQLLALSIASSFKRGVVLLASDCNTKWEIFHFLDANTITSQVYNYGSKAWDDFLQLLDSTDDRDYDYANLLISSLPQIDEQDLTGFEMSERDKKKARAEQDEIMLQHVADQLGDVYGERLSVPWWARANARVPDYYA